MTPTPMPISIKRIILEYENGMKLVVNESRTPSIGKLFFDNVKANPQLEWEIMQKPLSPWGKVKKFFTL